MRNGVAFRDSHHIAGAAVALAEKECVPLDKLSLAQLRGLHPACAAAVKDDALGIWNMENSVNSRSCEGGTSRAAVLRQAENVAKWVGQIEQEAAKEKAKAKAAVAAAAASAAKL